MRVTRHKITDWLSSNSAAFAIFCQGRARNKWVNGVCFWLAGADWGEGGGQARGMAHPGQLSLITTVALRGAHSLHQSFRILLPLAPFGEAFDRLYVRATCGRWGAGYATHRFNRVPIHNRRFLKPLSPPGPVLSCGCDG